MQYACADADADAGARAYACADTGASADDYIMLCYVVPRYLMLLLLVIQPAIKRSPRAGDEEPHKRAPGPAAREHAARQPRHRVARFARSVRAGASRREGVGARSPARSRGSRQPWGLLRRPQRGPRLPAGGDRSAGDDPGGSERTCEGSRMTSGGRRAWMDRRAGKPPDSLTIESGCEAVSSPCIVAESERERGGGHLR